MQKRAANRTLRFEGEDHGSGVSMFLVDNEPGEGPALHRHPYSETWVVRSGRARFTADGQDVEAATATSSSSAPTRRTSS
jgi:quercetin dioxygenase-like cupin family protein